MREINVDVVIIQKTIADELFFRIGNSLPLI
jgi:hypothetical protein